MTRLGDVLELIHSSLGSFRTARMSGRTDGSTWRLWWAGDSRFRFERDQETRGYVNICAGPVWWTLDGTGELHTNGGDRSVGLGMQPEFGLLHTRALLGATVLEIVREDRVAGREAVILLATPRDGSERWRWWGFHEPTEPFEIPIDLEYGVALGSRWHRVESVAFDEEFHPELFSRPDGHSARTRHANERPRETSLEEARRVVAFAIELPGWLPEGNRLVRCLIDPATPPGWVGLSWAIDPGYRNVVNLRQGPAVAEEGARARGRKMERHGTTVLVEGAGIGSHRVLVKLLEGWVEIESDLPLDTIVAVAASLDGDP